MLQIIKELNIEVTKPNVIQALVAKQYDMNTRFLKVTLMDCGVPITIPFTNTMKVVINAERKDGQSKGFDGVVNEDNTVTVPLHSWMLELEGDVICDISVMDTDKKLTTTSFTLLVEKAAYGGDDITSDPQHDVLVELIEEVKNSGSSFANALKGTASGTEVCIKDISPIPHNIGVKLSSADAKLYKGGKNLVKPDYYSKSTNTGGMEITLNPDGSVTFNGTSTSEVRFYFYSSSKTFKLPKGKYFLSGCPKNGSISTYQMNSSVGAERGNGLAFELTADNDAFALNFMIAAGQTVNFTVKPQIEMGSVGTEWEPYIEPTECVVNTDGTANVPSLYPTTRLYTDTEGVTIEAEYNRDINKAFAELTNALISLGGNV